MRVGAPVFCGLEPGADAPKSKIFNSFRGYENRWPEPGTGCFPCLNEGNRAAKEPVLSPSSVSFLGEDCDSSQAPRSQWLPKRHLTAAPFNSPGMLALPNADHGGTAVPEILVC